MDGQQVTASLEGADDRDGVWVAVRDLLPGLDDRDERVLVPRDARDLVGGPTIWASVSMWCPT